MFNNHNKRILHVSAGFPSPVEDFSEPSISLDKYLIKHPMATFMAYVNGDSMIDAGIYHKDILIIDRSLNAKNDDIIIAILNGEFIVKKLSIIGNVFHLISSKKECESIQITLDMEFEIWGVVIASIKKFR